MDPSTSTTNAPPTYEQAKVHTTPSTSEPTAPPVSEAPPPYEETSQEEIVTRHTFPVSQVTVAQPPAPRCSHCCNSVVCVEPGSTNSAEAKPVKCAACKRREAEEMAECCGGLLEVVFALITLCVKQ
ncbi:hypothetical protein Y032_0052g2237 [Ancylostoma ceylanicum]|uniref:Uncharacterized protein n=1 Tax=Ancylostoma ceylanicum TaxID=53326 RepID=A0A016U747_9BILA|nr:hypothetical protein Y032_0052g2237 [Ancylostoma ceylanicum]